MSFYAMWMIWAGMWLEAFKPRPRATGTRVRPAAKSTGNQGNLDKNAE